MYVPAPLTPSFPVQHGPNLHPGIRSDALPPAARHGDAHPPGNSPGLGRLFHHLGRLHDGLRNHGPARFGDNVYQLSTCWLALNQCFVMSLGDVSISKSQGFSGLLFRTVS
jgi:hypothetical protein